MKVKVWPIWFDSAIEPVFKVHQKTTEQKLNDSGRWEIIRVSRHYFNFYLRVWLYDIITLVVPTRMQLCERVNMSPPVKTQPHRDSSAIMEMKFSSIITKSRTMDQFWTIAELWWLAYPIDANVAVLLKRALRSSGEGHFPARRNVLCLQIINIPRFGHLRRAKREKMYTTQAPSSFTHQYT